MEEASDSPPPPPPPPLPPPPVAREERSRDSSEPKDRRERRDDHRHRDRDREKRRRSVSPPPPPPSILLPPPPLLPPSFRDRDRDRDRERDRDRDRDRERERERRRSPKRPRRAPANDYDSGHRPISPRYGYDGTGPYGGRDSDNERNYGRHAGSRSGFADGHGGSSRREGLMTYKQFIAELEDDILPAEAERRYEEYKNEYISTIKRNFFEQNKDEDWLREKYDPARLEAVILRRNENCKAIFKEFMAALEGGTLNVSATASGSLTSSSSRGENRLSEGEGDGSPKWKRSGRSSTKDQENGLAPKAHPWSADPKRIAKDIECTRALITKLDGEKGVDGNILASSTRVPNEEGNGSSTEPIVIVRGPNQVKGYEGVELLDVLLTYLWRIHNVDYYGRIESREQSKGLRHMRPEGKGQEDMMEGASEWEGKLDAFWQARLGGRDPLEAFQGKEKLDAITTEALDPFVRKIRDEKYGWKYGCGAKGCTKLFHGPEFVYKHLKLKHPEIFRDVVLKAQEEMYFQNYMSDPDAPGGTPTFSMRTGTAPKRGGGGPREMERGSGREGERYSNNSRPREEDRYERQNGRSPSRDYPMPGGGGTLHGGAASYEEPPAFDPFVGGGPSMRGHPPVPPPVLMPVPGAGPLGPFVPAPPDVAMRFMREHGGPPPPFNMGGYDGNFDDENSGGPSRARNGRSSGGGGSMMGNGMLDAPPMFDPRRVRSYHDLDAPEDDVTVIDYRSL